MSLINNIPTSSIPIQTSTSFTAEFNNPTLNKYDFNVSANENVFILTLRKNTVYYIDRINFSLDVDETDFKQSIDNANPITFTLKSLKTNKPIFPQPLPFINYVDNLEVQEYYKSGQSNDQFVGTLNGELFQSSGLVGDVFVSALIQLNIYQVTDQNWLNHYNDPRGRSQGSELKLRGY